jgi:hypothetical protein
MKAIQVIKETKLSFSTEITCYPKESIRFQPEIIGREIVNGRIYKQDLIPFPH